MATAGEDNFFRKKHTTTFAFGVAVLLFLLPFAEIRCNGITMASNSGIGLAIGTDYKINNDRERLYSPLDSDHDAPKSNASKGSGKVNTFALIALLLGVVGIGISFTNFKTGIINTVIGVAGALSLLALMVKLNSDLKEWVGGKDGNPFDNEVKISLAFTAWYYLCIVSFLAAAFFNFKRGQLLATGGAPSNAPQLDLENPGEQSEFPTAASESELG